MNRSGAIAAMNRLGKHHIPFLFIIDFDMERSAVLPQKYINNKEIIFDINGFRNYTPVKTLHKKLKFRKYPVNLSEYKIAFNKVQEELNAGNSYLLNLTFQTGIKTNLSLFEIFLFSQARYKLFYKSRFVVFSPEIFVQISDGVISSNPMKGTIDSLVKNARRTIMNSEKETAEHNTIVDLIRNDLSIVAKKVHVGKFRYIERIKTNRKTLLQVSSVIQGELGRNYQSQIGDIIFSLLPAGSVSGAPKKKTLEIIRKVETYRRGYYTGIFGCFDGTNLDSGVMIRFIEKTKNRLVYKSGGGITSHSDLRSEYREMIDKVYVPIV